MQLLGKTEILLVAIAVLLPCQLATPPKDYQLAAAIEDIRQRKIKWIESGNFLYRPMPRGWELEK